jgi:hypothetical protein
MGAMTPQERLERSGFSDTIIQTQEFGELENREI